MRQALFQRGKAVAAVIHGLWAPLGKPAVRSASREGGERDQDSHGLIITQEAVIGKALKVVAAVALVAVAVAAPYVLPGILTAGLGISSAVAAALITTAVVIGATMAARALTTGAPTANGVGPPQVFRQSVANSFIVYGKRRVGGLLVFFHPKKTGKRHLRYFVIACAGHRCKGVVEWMLGDEVVTVDGSGKVTSGPYANAAWLWFQRGLASETANATFVSECDGKWTTAHKGNQTAAIYAKFEMTDAVVQAGMPNIGAVIEGKDDIRDPRDDTEKYTRNAELIFYDWMATPREEGGFGAYPDEIPDDDFISANANVCDETVDGEERYAIDAVITTGAPPKEIRDVLTVNCAGSYTYQGGKFIMRPGYYVPVTVTLHEDDLAGPIQVSPFLPGDQSANEVQGTYISPEEGYQGAAFPTQSVVTDDIRQMDLDLAFITSPKRAARIARIMLNRSLAEKTATWPANITGLKVKALDTVQLGTSRYGLSNYAFQVTDWNLDAEFGVVLSLREESPEIYDPPAPVTITPPPTVAKAVPLIRDSDLTNLINTSSQVGLTVTVTANSIQLSNHARRYTDKDVAVTGDTVSGLTADTWYYVYYDDELRAGGTVTYAVTTSYFDAFPSAANPGRHYAGYAKTADSGGTGGGGGGSLPPGGGGSNPYDPIP